MRRFSLVLAVGVAIGIIDQTTKALVRQHLAGGRVVDLFGGFLRLDSVQNHGAAFGILQRAGGAFVLIALLVTLAILAGYRKIADMSAVNRLAIGLILGGALGNVLDRLRLGYVTDFIDLHWWPVFNFADSAITIGVAILLVLSLFPDRSAFGSD